MKLWKFESVSRFCFVDSFFIGNHSFLTVCFDCTVRGAQNRVNWFRWSVTHFCVMRIHANRILSFSYNSKCRECPVHVKCEQKTCFQINVFLKFVRMIKITCLIIKPTSNLTGWVHRAYSNRLSLLGFRRQFLHRYIEPMYLAHVD